MLEFKVVFRKSQNEDFDYERPKGIALLDEVEKKYSTRVHQTQIDDFILQVGHSVSQETKKVEMIIDDDIARKSGHFNNQNQVDVIITDEFLNKFTSYKIFDNRNPESNHYGPSFSCYIFLDAEKMLEEWIDYGFPTSIA